VQTGGPRQAIGELVTCSRCVGTWAGAGIAAIDVLAPRFGRVLTWSLAVGGMNDWLQAGFAPLTPADDRSGSPQTAAGSCVRESGAGASAWLSTPRVWTSASASTAPSTASTNEIQKSAFSPSTNAARAADATCSCACGGTAASARPSAPDAAACARLSRCCSAGGPAGDEDRAEGMRDWKNAPSAAAPGARPARRNGVLIPDAQPPRLRAPAR